MEFYPANECDLLDGEPPLQEAYENLLWESYNWETRMDFLKKEVLFWQVSCVILVVVMIVDEVYN